MQGEKKPALRYWLFQIPGLAIIGSIAFLLYYFGWITWWQAGLLELAWLVKDGILMPLTIDAYRVEIKTNTELQFVGKEGVVSRNLSPKGYVFIRAERWQAKSSNGAEVMKGTKVLVTAAEGLCLIVEPIFDGNPELSA